MRSRRHMNKEKRATVAGATLPQGASRRWRRRAEGPCAHGWAAGHLLLGILLGVLYGPFERSAEIAAMVDSNVVMAIEHESLPMAAVQFHPESILTLQENGLQLVRNVIKHLTRDAYPESSKWYKA